MSSFGGQWRVIRHYLSLTNLNAEVEKLVSKIKPATPEQWENLIKKFEKAVSVRLTQNEKEVQPVSNQKNIVKATAVEDTEKIESKEKIVKEDPPALSVGSEAKEITIEGLWQGLKLKKDLHFGKISEPSWKSNKPVVTKTSIHSRTAYVISALVSAESNASLATRVDSFIQHLHQYPEARDLAIKEGAVRALLRVQNRLKDDSPATKEVSGIVNEALALVGYTGPPRGPGPAVLSLDGGGIRGIVAIEILKHIEQLTGRRVHELFDYIIGVSTGAIIAAVIGSGVGTLETASEMYHTLSKEMFGNTSLIGGTSRLVWSHSYYDTDRWERMLQDNLRDVTLTQCNRHNTPKMALVSCVVNSGSRLSPFLFRSYSLGYRVRSVFPGTSRAPVWQAVRASAAAPTYFNEFRLDGLLHQDGGIMVNNPTGVGLHEARLLFGSESLHRGVVLSVGTGRALPALSTDAGTGTGTGSLRDRDWDRARDLPSDAGTSWRDKFNKILDSATDTEGVHLVVNDLLPRGAYYRLNPPLAAPCAMDETDPRRLQQLRADTHDYIRRNTHKIHQAADALLRRRTLVQKAADYIEHKAHLMGVNSY